MIKIPAFRFFTKDNPKYRVTRRTGWNHEHATCVISYVAQERFGLWWITRAIEYTKEDAWQALERWHGDRILKTYRVPA